MRWDVVVCGAGPAGSATALLLARAGLRVAIVERLRRGREKPCGEAFGPGVRAFLVEHGIALPGRGRGIAGMKLGALASLATIPYRSSDGREAFGFSGCRMELDALLLDAALAAGAHLLAERRVSSLAHSDRGLRRVTLEPTAGGPPESIDAALVVGAGGLSCPVARALGGRRVPGRFAVLAHVAGMHGLSAYGEAHLAGRGFTGVAPLDGTRANVAATLDPRDRARDAADAPQLWHAAVRGAGLAERLADARIESSIRTTGLLGFRPARLVANGVVLVGDASGFVDPFTGDGVSIALASARLAATAVLAALARGGATAQALAPYARAHRRTIGPRLAFDRVLQHAARRPELASRLVGMLAKRPSLAEKLLAIPADLAGVGSLARPRVVLGLLGMLLGPRP